MLVSLLLYHATMLAMLLLLTQSLAVLWRAELISFGHTAYFGCGAYVAAAVAATVSRAAQPRNQLFETDFIWLIVLPLAGGVGAMLAGWLTGTALRRLSGDYFAAATLIISQAFVLLASNLDVLGGALGYEMHFSSGAARHANALVWNAVVLAAGAVATFLLWTIVGALQRTRLGLQLDAARDNAIAAQASGVDTARLQRLMFTSSTAVAGFTGGLFLYFTGGIVPRDFTFISGLTVVICVVLGRAHRTGTFIATIVLYVIQEAFKLRLFGLLGFSAGRALGEMWEFFIALVLLLVLVGGPAFRSLRRSTAINELVPQRKH